MAFCKLVAAAGLSGFLAFSALPAAAQESAPPGEGIAGGALVATELTVLSEAIAGVRPAWVYVVSGTVAAAVGGYAGYLVERDADRDASAWLLAGGVVALIPTVIWVGNARETRVHPEQQTLLLPPVPHGVPPLERRSVLYVPLVRGVF